MNGRGYEGRIAGALIGAMAFAVAVAGCRREASPSRVKGASTQAKAPSSASAGKAASKSAAGGFDRSLLGAFAPLPKEAPNPANPLNPDKVTLGRMLYFDKRLSKNHDISCATCHDLSKWGVDGKPVSTGHRGQHGTRNAPTVYDAALHIAQFWDGRAKDVEEQAKGPILNPVEMAMPNEERVVATVKSIPQYVELFRKAFPGAKDPVTFDNVAKAIGAFERTLLLRSRWDAFLEGDDGALSPAEKAGLATFVRAGCTTCHNGPLVGGNAFQKLGLVKPWPDRHDRGRYEVTKKPEDDMVFKVPSLRNVAKTGPYFHDGRVATLKEAIRLMARHQLGKELTDEEVESIETFLGALTAKLPRDIVTQPPLPPSTPTTPKPDPT